MTVALPVDIFSVGMFIGLMPHGCITARFQLTNHDHALMY